MPAGQVRNKGIFSENMGQYKYEFFVKANLNKFYFAFKRFLRYILYHMAGTAKEGLKKALKAKL